MNGHSTALYDFIDDIQRAGWSEPRLLIQLGILLGTALLAWLLSGALKPRLRQAGAAHWKLGSEGIARVLFPLIFWISVEVASTLVRVPHGVTLLRLVASLLSAWVVVRTLAYLLHESFIQAEWAKRAVRPLAWLIWIVFALNISGVLPDIQEGLESISFPLGKQHVSLLMVINGLLSVAVTLLLAMWLGRLLEQRVMAANSLNLSLRVVITKLARTVLVVVAVMIALPMVGIDLTVLSVFGGALGVGLGFGLQKIASNYVSGFIILLDGSIRIGDVVIIDGRQGTVTGITARYVLLKLGDGGEAIIPNDSLISSTVLNLSHSDRLFRVAMPIQVAYDTDLDAASALLLSLTQGQPRILPEPVPQVLVKGFGESGIDLELAYWIGDPDQGSASLRSELNLKIWRAFKEQGIEIPYPRRDVYLINGQTAGNIAADQSSSAR
ncbi:mechanosensitive ion channel family protein [Chitinimonas sp.]|uniref:mechanosensitive ion channel family protein n=1 Tax=Chitinimonas sp. TaxID=1934313 RepID=UPI002F9413F5